MTTDLGQNVKVVVEGNKLVLTIDLSQNIGLSSSGKSQMIASTGGNVKLPNGVSIGVNAYRKA